MGSERTDETKDLATDNRGIREQLVCWQHILRKNRYLLDLADFQRSETPQAVPKAERLRRGICLDDVNIRDSK